jgi:hypothetical protein
MRVIVRFRSSLKGMNEGVRPLAVELDQGAAYAAGEALNHVWRRRRERFRDFEERLTEVQRKLSGGSSR